MSAVHQSQLQPATNKFHKGNGVDGKHYWLTPPDLYAELDAEFHFDFDPCPYPMPDGFDGLTCEWGQSSYCNPPFGSIVHQGKKKGPTAWMRKAIEEHRKGKTVVIVYPVDKWVLMMTEATGCSYRIRNLGDVKWCAIEDGSPGKGTGRHIAAFILQAAPAGPSPVDGNAKFKELVKRFGPPVLASSSSLPLCVGCGKSATCIGMAQDGAECLCDACCGHGGEGSELCSPL